MHAAAALQAREVTFHCSTALSASGGMLQGDHPAQLWQRGAAEQDSVLAFAVASLKADRVVKGRQLG